MVLSEGLTMVALEHFPVMVVGFPDEVFDGELVFDVDPGGVAQAGPEVGVAGHADDGVGEGVFIFDGDEEAGLFVADDVWDAAAVGGYDGKSGGAGFEYAGSETFAAAGLGVYVEGGEAGGDVFSEAGHLDIVGHAGLLEGVGQVAAEAAGAETDESCIGALVDDVGYGAE